MKEIIPNSPPRNAVELQHFTPNKEKYYAAHFECLGVSTKGIIISEKYISGFDKPATYVVLSMLGFSRHNCHFDYATHPDHELMTLIEYIELLHANGVKVFEFDSFKEMTDWLNS